MINVICTYNELIQIRLSDILQVYPVFLYTNLESPDEPDMVEMSWSIAAVNIEHTVPKNF